MLWHLAWLIPLAVLGYCAWLLRRDLAGLAVALGWSLWCWAPLWIFGAFVLGAMIAAAAGMDPEEWFALLFPSLIVGFFVAGLGRRARNGITRNLPQRLLSHIERGVRLHLPLPQWLSAAANDEPGIFRRTLRDIAQRLERGEPLSSALEAANPWIDSRARDLIASGEQFGRLPGTMNAVVKQLNHERDRAERQPGPSGGWIVITAVAALAAVSTTRAFIVPKYTRLIEDFDYAGRGWTLRSAPLLDGTIEAPINQGLLLVCTCLGLAMIYRSPLLRRSFWSEYSSPLRDKVVWHLPLLRQFDRDRGLADVCLLLSQSLRGGGDLARGVSEAAYLPINLALREQILQWRDALMQGLGPAHAARHARLPNYMQQMLALTQSTTALPDGLQMLAEHYHHRHQATLYAVQRTLLYIAYCITVLITAAIAWFMFVPLVDMIWLCLEQSLSY